MFLTTCPQKFAQRKRRSNPQRRGAQRKPPIWNFKVGRGREEEWSGNFAAKFSEDNGEQRNERNRKIFSKIQILWNLLKREKFKISQGLIYIKKKSSTDS